MGKPHVCPWWMGYFLINPLRKLYQNPRRILAPYVHEGMKVVDYGCGMGFFSLPLAQLVGPEGKVFCVDLQKKMINKLLQRARRAHVEQIIQVCLVSPGQWPLNKLVAEIDFGLLFAVVHEIEDKEGLFLWCQRILRPKGRILFAEPCAHVTQKDFAYSLNLAQKTGFIIGEEPSIRNTHAVILEKS